MLDIETKHKLSRASIQKILTLAQECLEHDYSWLQFKERCEELLKNEDKLLKVMLRDLP